MYFWPFSLQSGGHENTIFGRQGDTIVYSCTQYGRPWKMDLKSCKFAGLASQKDTRHDKVMNLLHLRVNVCGLGHLSEAMF